MPIFLSMKKTFLAKRNALLSSTSMSWGVIACASVILALLLRLFAPNFFWQMFSPVFRWGDALAEKSHFILSSFGDTAALALHNEQLRNENAALANENQALLAKEVSISALSNFSTLEGKDTSKILAGVVARPPESPYDTLVLAAGEKVGVMLGQEAFGAGGVPIGVVSSVLADFSRVTLFSAPNTVMHGWVGRENLPLTIRGAGAGAMRASLARSANIAVGDTVFVPGPGALPIGSVTRIDNDPTAPGVVLHITPALNLFSITWVVLRDTGIGQSGAFSFATSTL